MRIALIQFPGTTGMRETALAVKRAGMEPVLQAWNASLDALSGFAGYILMGGFSYEDRGRAGVIAARHPIMAVLKAQNEMGKPILGICNGAQLLVESGLVPGLDGYALGMALTDNYVRAGRHGFYNTWVTLRLADGHVCNAFTRYINPKKPLRLSIAHAEGRFVMPSALLDEIKARGLGVLQYCDATGAISPDFPVNPNGSVYNLAAVINPAGNVMAMMPHPERTFEGDVIFQSMRDYLLGYEQPAPEPLRYQPIPYRIQPLNEPASRVITVALTIADNHARTVEKALNEQGMVVTIKRYVHWAIESTEKAYTAIRASGMLYNENKERITPLDFDSLKSTAHEVSTHLLLVRSKTNAIGLQTKARLERQAGMTGIFSLRHGILWQIIIHKGQWAGLDRDLLFNPHAFDAYFI